MWDSYLPLVSSRRPSGISHPPPIPNTRTSEGSEGDTLGLPTTETTDTQRHRQESQRQHREHWENVSPVVVFLHRVGQELDAWLPYAVVCEFLARPIRHVLSTCLL
jgi:hypothetical protein